MPAVVLDFDGVLAIPWTKPVQLYSQIPDLLRRLSQKHAIFLASFNPTAIAELRRHGLLPLFTGKRAGCHVDQEIPVSADGPRVLGILSKGLQISSLRDQHLPETDFTHFYFFDDDAGNLTHVQGMLPDVHLHHIDEDTGLTEDVLAWHHLL